MPRLPFLLVVLAAGLGAAGTPASAQTVYHVRADAPPGGDGLAWGSALGDLRSALGAALPGDAVWVAQGTYTPGDGTEATGGRDAAFPLASGVALYGGFAGTETHPDQRDPDAHPTVLSGDLDGDGTWAGNAYHVVTAVGVDSTALLDGFVVTAGSADGWPADRTRGGGLYVEDGSPVVRNTVFRENRARLIGGAGGGGGVFVGGESRPVFERVVFERNGFDTRGGGGLIDGGARVVMRGATFRENQGSSGAGILLRGGSTLTVIGGRFERNEAGTTGGGIASFSSWVRLVNVVFAGNVAGAYGDELDGGGGMNLITSDLEATNVAFVGNRAGHGGGGSAASLGNARLTNVTVVGNVNAPGNPTGDQGAIRIVNYTGEAAFRNAVVWGNTGGGSSPQIRVVVGQASLEHVLLQGPCPAGASCASVFDADPLFVRMPSPGPDGVWGTADDDYGDLRLREGSPAVEAGWAGHLPPDTYDLDGDGDTEEPLPVDLAWAPRVQGAEVDLGAYEGAFVVSSEPGPGAGRGPGLSAPWPNPARGPVTLTLSVPASGDVTVAVYDVLGRRVAVLHEGPLASGEHALAVDVSGLAPGAYVVRASGQGASGSGFAVSRRITVVR